jgi:hypothetical protein
MQDDVKKAKPRHVSTKLLITGLWEWHFDVHWLYTEWRIEYSKSLFSFLMFIQANKTKVK